MPLRAIGLGSAQDLRQEHRIKCSGSCRAAHMQAGLLAARLVALRLSVAKPRIAGLAGKVLVRARRAQRAAAAIVGALAGQLAHMRIRLVPLRLRGVQVAPQ